MLWGVHPPAPCLLPHCYPPLPLQTVQLVLLPFAHAVSLPAQVAVQLACVGRVVWTVLWGEACNTTYFTHPRTHVVLREWHVWLEDTLGLLYIRPLWPARTPAPPPAQLCRHVGSFFVLFLGLVVQLGLQASFARRLFAAYCARQGRQRRQQDGRAGAAAGQAAAGERWAAAGGGGLPCGVGQPRPGRPTAGSADRPGQLQRAAGRRCCGLGEQPGSHGAACGGVVGRAGRCPGPVALTFTVHEIAGQ